MRNRALAVAGVGLFLFLVVRFGLGYGTRWKCGRLGMPEEVVPDNPFDHWIDTCGYGQELQWASLIAFAVLVGVVLRGVCITRRAERQLAAGRELLWRLTNARR